MLNARAHIILLILLIIVCGIYGLSTIQPRINNSPDHSFYNEYSGKRARRLRKIQNIPLAQTVFPKCKPEGYTLDVEIICKVGEEVE